MKIRQYYQYSWFSNLSYVHWSDDVWLSGWNSANAIRDANRASRVRGSPITPATIDTLGEKIFNADQWKIANYAADDGVGFSATFFSKGNTNDKVLAIRGTDPLSGNQVFPDLLLADFAQIGIIGMALSQTISMVNYINRLRATEGATNVARYELNWLSPPPGGYPSIKIGGLTVWLSANYDAVGLGLLGATDNVTVTEHSLGGHLATVGIRLFPGLFDNSVALRRAQTTISGPLVHHAAS